MKVRIFYFLFLFISASFCALGRDADKRLIVIPDIQGDIDALEEILTRSGATDENGNLTKNIELVFLGDMIGVGDNSPAVIEKLLHLVKQQSEKFSKVVLVAGNHEINLLRPIYKYLSKTDKSHWSEWLNDDQFESVEEAIDGALRGYPSHNKNFEKLQEFFKLLKLGYKSQFLFYHSGISRKMLEYNFEEIEEEFSRRMNDGIDQHRFNNFNHWLFIGNDNAFLTSQTSDPELSKFTLQDDPLSQEELEGYLKKENVDKLIVGHWESCTGSRVHSVYGD